MPAAIREPIQSHSFLVGCFPRSIVPHLRLESEFAGRGRVCALDLLAVPAPLEFEPRDKPEKIIAIDKSSVVCGLLAADAELARIAMESEPKNPAVTTVKNTRPGCLRFRSSVGDIYGCMDI